MQVINKYGKLEFEKAAYGGQALEQKPESSGYKVHEVTIKNKVYYFHYDKDRQCNKESGVLPEGNYFVDIDGKSVYGFFYDMEKFFLSRLDIYRTSYLDDKNILIKDNVYRDNFYIHGGSTYLDNKGIELAKDFDTFFDELSKYNEQKQAFTINNRTPIRVQVEYEKDGWRDPLDNMEICLFSEGGHYKPWYSSFSATTRDDAHQGIDLYARVGTPVYACMDGEIISEEWQHNNGNVILKVTGKQVEILRNMEKKDYQNILYNEIKTESYRKDSLNFKYDSDMFVFRYMHLDEVYVTNIGNKKYVKCGQIIGRSGIKKNANEKYYNSHNPHLHFEIASSDKITNNKSDGGLKHRINPRVYINYKIPNLDLSSSYILSVTTCQEYFKSGFGNNAYLNNAYKEFREQVECMLNPAPYRIQQKQ